MNKYVLLNILLYCCHTLVSGQTLNGVIIDSQNQPIPYVEIAIQKADSSYFFGAVSDMSGIFVINDDPNIMGIQLSKIGYTTKWVKIDDIGAAPIQLSYDEEILDGALIEARIPKTLLKGDAMVIMVDNTMLSQLGTANDIIRKLPGVIYREGNIEVIGKGVPSIYIDGRLIRDFSELELINSEEIKSIDIVRNPGGRYAATVMAVIRINTTKRKTEGIGFDIRSSWWQSNNTDIREVINTYYVDNGWMFFATLNYDKKEHAQSSDLLHKLYTNKLIDLKQNSELVTRSQQLDPIIGFDYQYNTQHSIGIRYSPHINLQNKNICNTSTIVKIDGVENNSLNTISQGQEALSTDHAVNVYYNGRIGNYKIDFNTDYLCNAKDDSVLYEDFSGTNYSKVIRTNTNNIDYLWASKLEVSRDLGKGNILLGTEYDYVNLNQDYENDGGSISNMKTSIKERNFNVFVEYAYPFKFGSLSAGIRYEHLMFKYYEFNELNPKRARTYNNFYPTISFNFQRNNFQLYTGYSIKTKRPNYNLLTNTIEYIDRYCLSTGNPTLKPEIYHDFTLTAIWQYIQLSVGVQNTQNAFLQQGMAYENNSDVILLYYNNYDRFLPRLSAVISANPVVGCWSPILTVGVQKQWFKLEHNGELLKLNHPLSHVNFTNNFNINKGFVLGVDYSYIGTGDDGSIRITKPNHIINISVKKFFLNDALSVELKGIDIFKTMQDRLEIFSNSYLNKRTNSYDSRDFGITIKYKFNNTYNMYKGRGAGEHQKYRM